MRRVRAVASLIVLMVLPTAAWSQRGGQTASPPAPAVQAMVAGILLGGRVIAAGVPLTSGRWGTDYITVSHALGVGATYAVIRDGLPYVETTPVAACSNRAHGIDVLILRAPTHVAASVVEWRDPSELRAGDELTAYVRREIHPTPVTLKFLHVNLLEWARVGPETWPSQWHNTMVAEGMAKPGFSGSPWVARGSVYGLFKGQVRLPNRDQWYPVAETAVRVKQCLQQLGYEHLVPAE
ncbi:MAG: hypothetical protein QN178_09365 [Armatimonadota bacterium]|nr:hypothetical protein [Armatimonadota bacterium]